MRTGTRWTTLIQLPVAFCAGIAAKAAPDGYTIGLSTSGPLVNNKFLYKSMPFDADKDLAPIALVCEIPLVIASNPKLPAKNLKEFVQLVKDAKRLATP